MIPFYSVQRVRDPLGFYAERLNQTMAGSGTDDKALIRIIISRSEVRRDILLSLSLLITAILPSILVTAIPKPVANIRKEEYIKFYLSVKLD